MPKEQFDADAFHAALDAQRQSRRLTWKKVAEEAGVSASSLTRMAQGRRPDVDTMAALLAWSGLDAGQFVVQNERSVGEADSLARITAYLRADPHLTDEGASALEAMLKVAYEQLRTDQRG
jgi:transcriptional regulator with XRE-family HTH domain